MAFLMGAGSLLAFLWCGYLCMHLVTDIQLGFAVSAFFVALILAGMSSLFHRLDDAKRSDQSA
jgi:hypothetical protein